MCVFPLLKVKFRGVMSIFYTHVISMFCLFFSFYDINKYSNALNAHLCVQVNP